MRSLLRLLFWLVNVKKKFFTRLFFCSKLFSKGTSDYLMNQEELALPVKTYISEFIVQMVFEAFDSFV